MKIRFSRLVHYYHTTILLSLFAIIAGGIYFCWSKGIVNTDNISAIFETSIDLENLKKRNDIVKIEKMVASDRARAAIKVMEKLEIDSDRINKTISGNEQYTTYITSMGKTKTALTSLISFPELKSIVGVFKNKVSRFRGYVESNNWRTLTRISKRIEAKVTQVYAKRSEFFHYSSMRVTKRMITKEIRKMRAITSGSRLAAEDKDVVLKKLSALKTEIIMLDKYLYQYNVANKEIKKLVKSSQNWIESVAPAISLKKIQLEKNSNILFFALISLVGLVLVFFAGGLLVRRYSVKHDGKQVEELIVEAVKDGIIPVESKLKGYNFSQFFFSEFDKFRKYIHTRMSFGTVFQEAMPFSAVLLDSNLKLSWANPSFYEMWGMESERNNSSSVTWDYLQKFTNLGEDDPVMLALKDKVAGIYQVQIKLGEAEAMPYEMYVSPVEYAKQSRIMVFFYPLKYLEDTIANQTKSLVGPVSRVLDSLGLDQFDESFQDKVKKDFEIAGIEHLFDKFIEYNGFVSQQKNRLVNEIEQLENELCDQHKLVDDMKNVVREKVELGKQAMVSIGMARGSIVKEVELKNKIQDLYSHSITTVNSLFKDEVDLLTQSEEVNIALGENLKAFDLVSATRSKFKDLKTEIADFRSNLLQSLNEAQMSIKIQDKNPEDILTTLSNIKAQIKEFEKIQQSFGQVVTTLDVSLSKVELLSERKTVPNFSAMRDKFDQVRDKLAADVEMMGKMTKIGIGQEEEMVKSLRDFIGTYKEDLKKLQVLKSLLVQSNPEVIQEVKVEEPVEELMTPEIPEGPSPEQLIS